MSGFPENKVLAYGAAIGLALVALAIVGGVVYFVDSVLSDEDPEPTIAEFSARILAKSALSNMDQSATLALCVATEYREDDDTWEIECTLEREDGTEVTLWEVTPNQEATLIGTRLDEG
jgi:hypothetical protein